MNELLGLVSYRNTVHDIYATVRERLDAGDALGAHQSWREGRDELWRHHPASPVPADVRDEWKGIPYWDYDPAYAFTVPFDGSAPLEGRDEPEDLIVLPGHRAPWGQVIPVAVIDIPPGKLFATWLHQYGGGLFIAFRDETNGVETYGGGRYLIDTAKGADLGMEDGELRIDLNFAFHPSCARSPEWNCPLGLDPALPPIRAGERLETPKWTGTV